MRYLNYILHDTEFQVKAREFTRLYFIKHQKRLISNHLKGEKKDFPKDWSFLYDILLKKQNYRCALCEKELNDIYARDDEHFRDKGHYWWLAYTYTNYYLACAECNRKHKHTKFPLLNESTKVAYETRKNIHLEVPLLINPMYDNPMDFFELHFLTYSQTNKNIISLKPLSSLPKTSLNYLKAQKTIEVLNLDLSKEFLNTKHQVLHNFYQDLIELAKNRKKMNREDFMNYYQKIKETPNRSILKLGFTAFILNNQFVIPNYLLY